MESQRFITLAIHTFHCANQLKAILEAEGIEVRLQNVDLDQPCSAAGVRVRIKESDLAFALRIVENPDVFATPHNAAESNLILVPVDFSDLSHRAIAAAFAIASRRHSKIHLLHAFSDPVASNTLQLSDSLNYDDVEQFEERADLKHFSETMMEKLCTEIRDSIKRGDTPPVGFTSETVEGLPEDAIMQWCKANSPSMIVMATRGAATKERELIGSVTAEVLDTVRFPIFTVPPSPSTTTDTQFTAKADGSKFCHVMMFITFEQDDYLALDALHRFLPPVNDLEISFVKIEKNIPAYNAETFHNLLNYAEKRYPDCHFSVSAATIATLMDGFSETDDTRRPFKMPDLIVVPNKKKNAFARLFNPGIAHRLLFHTDIPMMVVPV